MENLVFLAPFIPFIAMLPPAFAAMWIANRWIKSRDGGTELRAELSALRDDLAALRQLQSETQERLDFTERVPGRGARRPQAAPVMAGRWSLIVAAALAASTLILRVRSATRPGIRAQP